MTQLDLVTRQNGAGLNRAVNTGQARLAELARAQMEAGVRRRAAALAVAAAERELDAGRELLSSAATAREAVDRMDALRETQGRLQQLRESLETAAREEASLRQERQDLQQVMERASAGPRTAGPSSARPVTAEVSSASPFAPAGPTPRVDDFGFGTGAGERLQAAREAREREERLRQLIPPSLRGVGETDLAGLANSQRGQRRQRQQPQATQTPVPPSRRISGETDLAGEMNAQRGAVMPTPSSRNIPATRLPTSPPPVAQVPQRFLTEQDLIDFVEAKRNSNPVKRFLNSLPFDPINEPDVPLAASLRLDAVTFAFSNPILDPATGARAFPVDDEIVTIDGFQIPIGHPLHGDDGISILGLPTVPEGSTPGFFFHEALHGVEQREQPVPGVWEIRWRTDNDFRAAAEQRANDLMDLVNMNEKNNVNQLGLEHAVIQK